MPSFPRGHLLIYLPPSPVFRNSLRQRAFALHNSRKFRALPTNLCHRVRMPPECETMELYLVQHGAAKTEAEDPQRSLTEEGMRTVERMGEHLDMNTLRRRSSIADPNLRRLQAKILQRTHRCRYAN